MENKNNKYYYILEFLFLFLFLILFADIAHSQIVCDNKLIEESKNLKIYMMATSDNTVWLSTDKGLIRYLNDSLTCYLIDTNDEKNILDFKGTMYDGNSSGKEYDLYEEYDLFKELLTTNNQTYLLFQNIRRNRLYITKIENEKVYKYKFDIDTNIRIHTAIINNNQLYIVLGYKLSVKIEEGYIEYLTENSGLKKIASFNFHRKTGNKIIAYNNQFYLLARDEDRNGGRVKPYFSIYHITPEGEILLKRYNDSSYNFMFWNYYQDDNNLYVMNFEGDLINIDLETQKYSILYNLNTRLNTSIPFFVNDNKIYYYLEGFKLNVLDYMNLTKNTIELGNNNDCRYYVQENYYLKGNKETYCLCNLANYQKKCKEPILKYFRIND